MSQAGEEKLEFDSANLYREETYTDLRMGSIRRLVPVTVNGEDDSSRPLRFQGQAAMMTPAGQLPLNFEIEAEDLAAAIAAFPDAVNEEAGRVMEELRDLQRKQELASPILQPGGPGGPGGKIQL